DRALTAVRPARPAPPAPCRPHRGTTPSVLDRQPARPPLRWRPHRRPRRACAGRPKTRDIRRRRGPTAPRARAVGGGPGPRRRSGSPASRSPGRGQRPRWSIIPHVVVLAYDGLLGEAAALAPNFRAAEPFPHAVIDGLFDDEKLSRAVDAFPAPDAMAWYQ